METSPPQYVVTRTGDGFEIREPPAGVTDPRAPIVHADKWSSRIETVVRESGARTLAISPWWEGDRRGVDFLGGVAAQIRSLAIGAEFTELRAIEGMPNLEDLNLRGPIESLDFARLTKLRSCLLQDVRLLGNVYQAPQLLDLALMGGAVRDLRVLGSLKRLRRLHLNGLKVLDSLEGVERLPLEVVELLYLPRLRSIGPLAALEHLRSFEIVRTRGVRDLAVMGSIPSLQTLVSSTGPALSSLDFIGNLPRLQELGIGNEDPSARPLSLAPIARAQALRTLSLFDMPHSIGVEHLSRLHSLTSLILNRGPELPSLEFALALRRLRELVILRTKIRNLDLRSLLALPHLERVTIRPLGRKVRATFEEIDAELLSRHPDRSRD